MEMAMNGNNRKVNRNKLLSQFYLIWTTQTFALFGSSMAQFALIWWIALKANSAIFVSLATAIALLPRIFINPILGALADRWNRKMIMIASDFVIAVCSLSLFLLLTKNKLSIIYVIIVLLIRATADTFHSKAMISSTSLLVPPEKYTKIAGLNQAFSGLIMFLTPATGAYLLKSSSIMAVIAIDFTVAVTAIIPLVITNIPQKVRDDISKNVKLMTTTRKDIKDGLLFISKWEGAIGMLIISSAINFIVQPFFNLLPILVRKTLNGAETEYGIIGALSGLGFLVGGILLSIIKRNERRMCTSLIGISISGIALIWTGLTGHAGIAYTALGFFITGVSMPFCMGPIQALIQEKVPNEMQARVFSIIEAVSNAVAPIGIMLAGIVYDNFSPLSWFILGGIVALCVALSGFLNSRVRNLG
jgi:MFS transporter, DHA3 family, macrolide efflux protein